MIRLRPYYLYTIFRQLAAGDEPADQNSIPQITKALVEGGFREKITLVQHFCDACKGCPSLIENPEGCLWGEGRKCRSAQTAKRLNQVEDQMRSILYDLGMQFGDSMEAGPLLKLAAERRPWHYFHIPEWQKAFEKGVGIFRLVTGIKVEPPGELRDNPHYRRMYEEAGTETDQEKPRE